MTDKLTLQIAIIDKLLKKPENKLCADCKRPSPCWASINIGVFVCIKCAGIHREIGVHVTKIKSINLDLWPSGALNYFLKINNKIANQFWECKLKDMNFEKIRNDDYRLEDFIRDKYERRRYVKSKKKDPMTLIIEGNDCEEEASKEESEEDESDSPKEKVITKVKPKAGKSFGLVTKKEIVETIPKLEQKTNVDNGCLIEFTNDGENQSCDLVKTSSEPVASNKQYEFSFMNTQKSAEKSNAPASNNLIDLNAFAQSKDTQLHALTENILKVYNTPSSPEKPSINVLSMNNPNISIQNTYCNCKTSSLMCNCSLGKCSQGVNGNNQLIKTPINTGQFYGQAPIYTQPLNCGGYLYNPMQQNFMNNNSSYMNVTMTMNMKPPGTQFPTQSSMTYTNAPMNLTTGFGTQPLLPPKPATFNSTFTPSTQSFTFDTDKNKKKKDEDPFKSLVSFK